MRWAKTDIGPELGRELGQVRQGCSDYKTTKTVAYEAHLTYAGDGAEGQDVLLDLSSKPLTHFHYVALCLIFVTLREQDYRVWVLEWYLVFK